MMMTLDNGYTVEFVNIDKQNWHNLLVEFEDVSFYQTWSYGSVQWGDRQLSHFLLKYDSKIVAMAQLRIVGLPMLRIGIAYINWGPMWHPKGEPENIRHLQNAMRALRMEYAIRRGYLLRVLPRISSGIKSELIRKVLENEGYAWSEDPLQTIILDLKPPIEVLRRSLRGSWSHSLKFAEKQGLEIIDVAPDESIENAQRIVAEMRMRKQFYGCGQATAAAAHTDLPNSLKLKITICRDHGEPVALLGWTTVGQIGFILLNGTSHKALKSKASFLLWWKMVEYYKSHGFLAVDLAGVNAERNPGGFFFKSGLAGKNFTQPNRFIGQFDTYGNPVSAFIARTAYGIHSWRKQIWYKSRKLFKLGTLAKGFKSPLAS